MMSLLLATLLSATAGAPQPANNARCPVMGTRVAAEGPTATVEGRQYRLCCKDCAEKLQKDAHHYLNPDGSLTGAWEDSPTVNHY